MFICSLCIVGCEVGVIDGVERALLKMKKGETANVEIGPKYAYDTAGSDEKGVPPNATLHYTITLNNFDKVSIHVLLLMHTYSFCISCVWFFLRVVSQCSTFHF